MTSRRVTSKPVRSYVHWRFVCPPPRTGLPDPRVAEMPHSRASATRRPRARLPARPMTYTSPTRRRAIWSSGIRGSPDSRRRRRARPPGRTIPRGGPGAASGIPSALFRVPVERLVVDRQPGLVDGAVPMRSAPPAGSPAGCPAAQARRRRAARWPPPAVICSSSRTTFRPVAAASSAAPADHRAPTREVAFRRARRPRRAAPFPATAPRVRRHRQFGGIFGHAASPTSAVVKQQHVPVTGVLVLEAPDERLAEGLDPVGRCDGLQQRPRGGRLGSPDLDGESHACATSSGSIALYPTLRTVAISPSYRWPSFARKRRTWTSTVRVPP